jgi:acyl carrier protein
VTSLDQRARVLTLVAGVLDVDATTIQPDRLLVEHGLDSARAMDLVVALEDEFGLSIPDDDARGLRSVDDIVRFISSQVNP